MSGSNVLYIGTVPFDLNQLAYVAEIRNAEGELLREETWEEWEEFYSFVHDYIENNDVEVKNGYRQLGWLLKHDLEDLFRVRNSSFLEKLIK